VVVEEGLLLFTVVVASAAEAAVMIEAVNPIRERED